MAFITKLKYLRIAPRKVRLVADLIRGKTLFEAKTILNFTLKKGVLPLTKFLDSSAANVKNNFKLDENNLYIARIFVDGGPKLKRWMPRARGSAEEIHKRTSHITLVLEEIRKTSKKSAGKRQDTKNEGTEVKAEVAEIAGEKSKPKFRPESDVRKPKTEKGGVKIFRRKSFSK